MNSNLRKDSVCRELYQTPVAEEIQYTIEGNILSGSTPGTGSVIIVDDDFGDDMVIIINF